MSKALLYDSTVCIGCKQCEQACADQNKLPYNDAIAAEQIQSDHKMTVVLTRNDKFMRRLCMNCNDPSCASVCPVGALKKTALGPVTYDASKCMGCRYCMVACPFSVPKYEWGKLVPKVQKCTMCPDRVAAGKQTACAEICPTGATKFGDRDELIAEAQKRIRDNPSNYVNHIYGLEEVGGTSVLLLSAVPFETFGYKSDLTKDPMPMLTYRVLSHIPDFVPLGGMVLGGIWWITHRREEVALAEGRDPGSSNAIDPKTANKNGEEAIMPRTTFKFTFWKVIFLFLIAAGAYSTFVRFTQGLGASTHLSDQFPWGIWISFDVLCGVMLAAGGFTLTAAVHILNIKRLHSIIRPTILTAFLGYILVSAALMFDLGKPYNIWHPLIMRNPHSVMFEVAYCVMLYTTVLALEFSPIVLERFNLQKPLKVVRAILIPLVIFGVILSTLHQSSLGTLYLIVPEKLYPLWYSPLLPVFFFLSAIAVGLAMTIFESSMSSKHFGVQLELPVVLQELGRVLVVVLGVYAILRFEDLANRGVLKLALQPGYEMYLFWLEISLAIILPLALLVQRRVRSSANGLYFAAVLVVLGFITNRMNVSITGFEGSTGVRYFPKWTELAVTGSIIAVGFALFGMAVKYLPIFPKEELSHEPVMESDSALPDVSAVMEHAGD